MAACGIVSGGSIRGSGTRCSRSAWSESACWRSRCELIGQTSRRRCSGSRWWSSRACRSPGVGGLRSSSRRSCPRRSRPRRCSATGPSSSRCCGSRCTPPLPPSATAWSVLLPVAVLTSVAISVGERWDRGLNWVEILTDLVVTFGVPFLLGRMTFNRRRRIVREREVATREAVAAERAAIARELHDVVAHHMSVMVVQAGAARAVSGSDPAATAEALRQIEASGRTGLAEMRRLLEVLKAERRRREGAAAGPRPPRRAPRRDAGLGPAGRSGRRRSAATAVARRRPVRLPHRPGGAHQRPPACRRRERPGRRALAGRARARDRRRRPGPPDDPEASGGHGLIGMRAGSWGAARRPRPANREPRARLPSEPA